MASRSRSRSRSRGESRSRSPLPPPEFPRRSISPRASSRSRSPREERVNGGQEEDGFNRGRSRSISRSRSAERGRRGSSADRSLEPRTTKIVVEKLTKNVNEGHLREIFGAFGAVQEIELPMNRQFMSNRGTAYILYENSADAEVAIAHMHEAQLDGAVINVSVVLPRRKFSRTPPPSRRIVAHQAHQERFDARGPPGGFRGRGALGAGRGRYRSPPRRSPPPRHPRGERAGRDFDTWRPRSASRSRSPRRSRSRSYSSRSRSRSRSPPMRRGSYRRRESPPPRSPPGPRGRRRRSPSYSSYSSRSGRSPSRSRSRGRASGGRR